MSDPDVIFPGSDENVDHMCKINYGTGWKPFGLLVRCRECNRWWEWRLVNELGGKSGWVVVRWYNFKARERIRNATRRGG